MADDAAVRQNRLNLLSLPSVTWSSWSVSYLLDARGSGIELKYKHKKGRPQVGSPFMLFFGVVSGRFRCHQKPQVIPAIYDRPCIWPVRVCSSCDIISDRGRGPPSLKVLTFSGMSVALELVTGLAFFDFLLLDIGDPFSLGALAVTGFALQP